MHLPLAFLFLAGGSLFLGIFLATFLITQGGRAARSQQILGFLILACALNAAHPVLAPLLTWHPRGGQFFEPLQFLLAPLMTAYAASLLHNGFPLRPGHLLHFLPLLAASGVAMVFTLHATPSWGITVALWTALAVQMVAYLIPTVRILRRYESSLKARVSNLEPVDLNWLRSFYVVIVALCLVAWGLWVVILHSSSRAGLGYAESLAMTGAVWVLGYRGLRQKVPETPEGLDSAPVAGEPAGRIETFGRIETPVAPPRSSGQRDGLIALFEHQKPYLEPDLGLDDLARRMEMPRNQLSALLNDELGVSFYDFVNGYRVEELRALLADPVKRGEKLLTLAFAAGFNSKPTFNKVVKKHTGMTPSELRAAIESRPSR